MKYIKLLITLSVLGFFWAMTNTVFAATITVDTASSSVAGDGFCSLQEAVANANGNSDTTAGDCTSGQTLPTIDVIEFAIPGVGPHTITTSSQINIEESVTIDGTTQTGTVCTLEGGVRELQINIDASGISGNSNIFNIGNENDLVDDVTIKGLALYGNAYGFAIATWSNGTVIQCNNIGTDTLGLTAYPNSNGFVIYDNDTNIARTGIVIGGSNPGDGNLISGNGFNGESFDGWGIMGAGQGMIIQGNWIGLDITGQAALGNQNAGINFGNGATISYDGVQILDNVISGNGIADDSYSPGINIGGSDESGTAEPVTNLVIKGNIIGLSADGMVGLGNENDGIGILARAIGITIGGPLEGERNIISGNGDNGINIAYDVQDVTIQGNYIGTDITGGAAIENGSQGININDGDRAQIITNILIGGDTEAEGNVFSGNTGNGIYIDGDSVTISGNKIGTDPTGLICIGNGNQGIQNSALTTNLLIGGDTAGERNIIGCSVNSGLYLEGPATVQGNYIGVGADGETDIATQLGDTMDVGIEFFSETIIGGNLEAEGNIIRYSLSSGIKASAPTGSSLIQNNTLLDNIIGISVFNTTDNPEPVVTILQNSITSSGQIGIDLANDSDDDGNIDGVGAATQNSNDADDVDTGPNGYINHPVVLMTMQDGSDMQVLYGLDVPVGYYRIEFFTNPTNGIADSGFGEGEIYEDYAIVSKTTEGFETFTKTLTNVNLDDDVTTTVTTCTDVNCTEFLGTSEFSNTAPPGVDYDNTDYTASHVLNTIYLGTCVNGDNGDATNTDTMGPNQVGAYLGTGPCTDDRDGVSFINGSLVPSAGSFSDEFTPVVGDGGLNDATFSGDYTGVAAGDLYLIIESIAPDNGDSADRFMWSNGVTAGEPIAITAGVPQLVRDGIYVTFTSATGHTAFSNDTFEGGLWTLTLTPGGLSAVGVEQESQYSPSDTIVISVTASAAGYLHAWMDMNDDGDFLDAGEHLIDNETVVDGESGFSFTAPASDGTYHLRIRYTSYSDADLGPTGVANDGEVEDYVITVVAPSTGSRVIGSYSRSVTPKKQNQAPTLPVDIIGSGQCPANLIIDDFMKQGDRDGKYSTYNKKVVTEVSLLQSHINRILKVQYAQAAGPTDGIFGPLTKQGVMRLQTALNSILKPVPPLKIDGIVGPFTRSAINNSCGGM